MFAALQLMCADRTGSYGIADADRELRSRTDLEETYE